jgi:hypothetical protein avisC_00242
MRGVSKWGLRLTRRRIVIAVLVGALVLSGAVATVVYAMTDRCEWTTVHHGYGKVSCTRGTVRLSPKTSTSSDETHAALATVDGVNIEENATQTISATMRTDTQLRTGDDPNPWEVAWFLWNYTDDQHFYAVVLKPNGWEISKEDPAYPGAQRFLASGDSPTFPVGSAFDITVTITTAEDAVTMTVSVGGAELATVTDRESPYPSGAVAAYTEDATITVGPVAVESGPVPN